MVINVIFENCPWWYIPYRNLALAAIASGKSDPIFILSKMFEFWSEAAGLSVERTKEFLLDRITNED